MPTRLEIAGFAAVSPRAAGTRLGPLRATLSPEPSLSLLRVPMRGSFLRAPLRGSFLRAPLRVPFKGLL